MTRGDAQPEKVDEQLAVHSRAELLAEASESGARVVEDGSDGPCGSRGRFDGDG